MTDPNAEAGFDEFWRQVGAGIEAVDKHNAMTFDFIRSMLRNFYSRGWIDAQAHVIEYGMSAGNGVRLTLDGVTLE